MSKLNITDLSNDFSANPMTGDVSVKRDSDAIKQSLKNLLLLEQFDKPFNPNLNAGLRQFLFESLPEPILQDLIGQRVQYIIETYEPRIELVGVKVGFVDNENALNIVVEYKLVNTKNLGNEILQILLERVR